MSIHTPDPPPPASPHHSSSASWAERERTDPPWGTILNSFLLGQFAGQRSKGKDTDQGSSREMFTSDNVYVVVNDSQQVSNQVQGTLSIVTKLTPGGWLSRAQHPSPGASL